MNQLYFVEATFGFTDLIKLLEQDYQYFSTHIMVFDGDARQAVERFRNKHRDWNNWLLLPGDVRPEQVIFEEVWATRDQKRNERDQYKTWFKSLQDEFVKSRVLEFWKKDHPEQYNDLLNQVGVILGIIKPAQG